MGHVCISEGCLSEEKGQEKVVNCAFRIGGGSGDNY